VSKVQSHIVSQVARLAAIYSASIVNTATVHSFHDAQEIAAFPNKKIYPNIDL